MDEQATVSWTRCPQYESSQVEAAFRRVLQPLGGLERWVRPGDRVLCKVNLLMPATPRQAVCTHPEVLRAAIREVKRCGGIPLVGDNSASTPFKLTLQRAGLLDVCSEEGAELVDLTETVEIASTKSHTRRSFIVSAAMLQADVLLNLPKLKNHALCYMTLALKNHYGFVPGLHKARWHLAARTPETFSALLVDLVAAISEHGRFRGRMVHVLDGIIGLEGDGPGTGGTPRPLGILLASTDPVALDRVACHAVGLDACNLLTCAFGGSAGLGQADLARIRIVEEPMEKPLVTDWKPPKWSGALNVMNRLGLLNRLGQRLLLERPVVDLDRCTGCGQCQRICASGAAMVDRYTKKASVDLDRCIRCYCCAEVCPEAAMQKSETPWLGRLVGSPWFLRFVIIMLVVVLGGGIGLLGLY